MRAEELRPGMLLRFRFRGETTEGTVTRADQIAIMRQKDGKWKPLLVPKDLLDHIEFELLTSKPTGPIYKQSVK